MTRPSRTSHEKTTSLGWLLGICLAVLAAAAACGDSGNPAAPSAVGGAGVAAGSADDGNAGGGGQAPGAQAGGIGRGRGGNGNGNGAGGNGNGSVNGNGASVAVCHRQGNGAHHTIIISPSALPDHRAHGDALPGELVPGSSTTVFNVACEAISFGIDIEKSTAGQDADTPPGPSILTGGTVEWTYVVTNTGEAGLSDVEVTDDQGVALTCDGTVLGPQGHPEDSLTCTASGPATEGQYANTGTATGATVGVVGNEEYLIPENQGRPSDSDDSHYFGASPALALVKKTNGQEPAQPSDLVLVPGDSVDWTYEVTNTGNAPLTGVAVTDDQGVAVSCGTDSLGVGETVVCTASGIVTVGPYTNVGTATASFTDALGQQATPSTSDTSHYLGGTPSIRIEKSTDGEDADSAPGPTLQAGSPVTWQYAVTNDGILPLTDVVVSDNLVSPIDCGGQTSLAVGETMICSATGVVIDGQYENIGRAEGRAIDALGVLTVVSDEDPSHYFGARSRIAIEKATNGQDADAAPGPEIPEGDPVAWTYVVTNEGTDTLSRISVQDDQGVTVSCPTDTLAPGGSMTCTASGLAALGQYRNVGTAEGTDPGGVVVTDSDPSHYRGIAVVPQNPAVRIEKATNGVDADTQAAGPTIPAGAVVTWTYAVTNTGNVPLYPVLVADSDVSLDPNCLQEDADGPLLPGETRVCTATGPAVEGDYENTGTVTATPADAQGVPTGAPDVVATDLSHYTGVAGGGDAIRIEKSTQDGNGTYRDADSAPGPTLSVGGAATWRYQVTNSGTGVLTDITVTDDQGVAVVCLVNGVDRNGTAALVAGGTLVCNGTGTVVAGQYANVGTVTANGAGGPVTASDPSHYFGEAPAVAIDIEKSTNDATGAPQDADAAPGPTLAPGDTVTWTYVVTNTGAEDLTGVAVTDDDASAGITCGSGIPDPFVAGTSFTCTATGATKTGQYQNIGTATGLHAASGVTVSDTDPSHYFVPLPENAAIRLEKSTNGFDADGPEEAPQIEQGQQVTWLYEATNTGGVDLTNVVVTDDQLGAVCTLTFAGEILAPNDTESCTATGTAADTSNLPGGVYANTGTVTAVVLSDGSQVTDTDDSHYRGLGGLTVDIEKATNEQDADSTPVALTEGAPVTWSYVVTNTSDVALVGIAVVDDREGPVTCPQTTLDPGESMTCTEKTGKAVVGSYRNVATVTAEAADGRAVSESDPSNYVGTPVEGGTAVDIQKYTNGVDTGASGPGPNLTVGDTVTWTYVVTNIGNVPIGFTEFQVIVVTDDQEGLAVCPLQSLTPGQSMTCTASGTVVEGDYVNVGTVEVRQGNPNGPIIVSDTDPSHYTGNEPNQGR